MRGQITKYPIPSSYCLKGPLEPTYFYWSSWTTIFLLILLDHHISIYPPGPPYFYLSSWATIFLLVLLNYNISIGPPGPPYFYWSSLDYNISFDPPFPNNSINPLRSQIGPCRCGEALQVMTWSPICDKLVHQKKVLGSTFCSQSAGEGPNR